ncbi:MAG: chromate transporter [Lachnospiraceae bacterium]|nr:chromate transporter [Lachnospiraceae bacterium]
MGELLELFLTFAKVGVLTFGGGYAMLPILEREICTNKHWVDSNELMDYYAIGQCTPGVIAVNLATFVGKKRKGIPGGIVATLGVVFPSLLIITFIAALISNFAELVWVEKAFTGIRICVCVLIFNSVVKLYKGAVKDLPAFIIFCVVAICSVFLSISPVIYVIIAGALGILIQNFKSAGDDKAKEVNR